MSEISSFGGWSPKWQNTISYLLEKWLIQSYELFFLIFAYSWMPLEKRNLVRIACTVHKGETENDDSVWRYSLFRVLICCILSFSAKTHGLLCFFQFSNMRQIIFCSKQTLSLCFRKTQLTPSDRDTNISFTYLMCLFSYYKQFWKCFFK